MSDIHPKPKSTRPAPDYRPYQVVESVGNLERPRRTLVLKSTDDTRTRRVAYAKADSVLVKDALYDYHGHPVTHFSDDIESVEEFYGPGQSRQGGVYIVRVRPSSVIKDHPQPLPFMTPDQFQYPRYRLATLHFYDQHGQCETGRGIDEISYADYRAGTMRLETFGRSFTSLEYDYYKGTFVPGCASVAHRHDIIDLAYDAEADISWHLSRSGYRFVEHLCVASRGGFTRKYRLYYFKGKPVIDPDQHQNFVTAVAPPFFPSNEVLSINSITLTHPTSIMMTPEILTCDGNLSWRLLDFDDPTGSTIRLEYVNL